MISVASPQRDFANQQRSLRPAYGPGEARLLRARKVAQRRRWAQLSALGGGVALLALTSLFGTYSPTPSAARRSAHIATSSGMIEAAILPSGTGEMRNRPVAATRRPDRLIAPRSDDAPGTGKVTASIGVPAGVTQVPWGRAAVNVNEQIPTGLPLEAPFVKWGVSSDRLGVYCAFQDPAYPGHTGIDLQVDPGAAVVATLTSTVVWAGDNGAYGNLVVIESGRYQAWYAHLSRIDVAVGDELAHGDALGLSGGRPGAEGAGSSGGPHLHYAIRLRAAQSDGDLWLDPAAYLPTAELDYLGCSR